MNEINRDRPDLNLYVTGDGYDEKDAAKALRVMVEAYIAELRLGHDADDPHALWSGFTHPIDPANKQSLAVRSAGADQVVVEVGEGEDRRTYEYSAGADMPLADLATLKDMLFDMATALRQDRPIE